MFAVVRTGGKQYRVAPGDKIVVEKLDGNAGDRITLGDVLLAGDGSDLKSTDGLIVAAEIIAQAKDRLRATAMLEVLSETHTWDRPSKASRASAGIPRRKYRTFPRRARYPCFSMAFTTPHFVARFVAV